MKYLTGFLVTAGLIFLVCCALAWTLPANPG